MGLFLKIAICIATLSPISDFNLNGKNHAYSPYEVEFFFSGGRIVVNDIIAFVDTGDTSDHIDSFTMYDGATAVYSAGSTASSTNNYNLGGVQAGIYLAKVITEDGNVIQEYVFL